MSANAALKDARKALDGKDWAAALKYAQQALELDKNNYNAFIFCGLAQYNLGQVQKGEQAYIQATQIEPKNIVAWQGLADLYSKTNNKTKLVEVYEKMLEVMGPAHAKYRATLSKVISTSVENKNWTPAQNQLHTLIELLRGDTSETGVKERLAAQHQLLHVRGEGQHEEVLKLLIIWARKEFTDVDDTVLIAQVTGVMNAPASESRDKARDTSVKKEIDIGEENRRARYEQIRSAVSERRYEYVNDILTRDFAQTEQLYKTLLSESHDDYLTVLLRYTSFLMRQLQLTAMTPVKAAPVLKLLIGHLRTFIDKHPQHSPLPYLYYLTLSERDDTPITWSDVTRVTQRFLRYFPAVSELTDEPIFGVSLLPPQGLGWLYLAALYLFIATPVPQLTRETASQSHLAANYRNELLHKAMAILTRHHEQTRDMGDSLMAHYCLARLYLDSKNYVRAMELAKKGLEVIKQRASHQAVLHSRFWVQYHVVLAECAMARSDLTAVKQIWSSVLKFDAANVQGLKGMAHIAHLTRDLSTATRLYTQLSALVDVSDEDYHVIHTRLAWCRALPAILREQQHYLQHVLNSPAALVSQAQARMPSEEEISAKTLSKEDLFELMNTKTALIRAIEHVTAERNKEHVTLRHRQREDEEAVEYHVTLARLQYWLGGDSRKLCQQHLLTALDLALHAHAPFMFQHVSLAWCLLGEWYHTIGAIVPKNRALAVESWLRALRVLLSNSRLVHYHHGGDPLTRDDTLLALVSPLAGTRLLSAWLHDPARDLQHSIQLLNELSHAVNATWTLFPLGLLYLRAADYANAVNNFQKFLRQQPRHLKAWLSLAECYRRQGKLTAALRVAERAKELSSEARDQQLYAHWTATIIGNIKLRLGFIDEARDEYSSCLRASQVTNHVLQSAYQQLAIQGVANSSLLLMRKLFKEGRFRQARDQLNLAEEILNQAHVLGHAHLISVWKLLGDIYTQHFLFRHHHAELSRDAVAEHYRSVKEKLVAGTKSYLRAIQLEKDRADLYSDLAVNGYFQAVFALELNDNATAEQSLTQAEQHLKTAIDLEQQAGSPSRDKLARYWTALGCVLAQLFRTREHKARDHTLLNKAQHSFIVAARFSERHVAALRNIALLSARVLLRAKNSSAVRVKLCESVLRDALRVDPSDAATWTTLSVILSAEHAEQVLPYLVNAHDLDPNQSLAVQLMTHVTHQRQLPLTPKIRLAAVQYLERHVTDVTALNQLAVLFLDLACTTDRSDTALASLQSAVRYLRTAVTAAEIKNYSAHHQTILKLNLARVLTQIAHRTQSTSVNDEALAIFSAFDKTPSVDVLLNLALARVTSGDLPAAVTILGQARLAAPNMARLIDTLIIKLRYAVTKKGKKADLDELKKYVVTIVTRDTDAAIFGAVIAVLTEDEKMFSECVSKCQMSISDPLNTSVHLLNSHWHVARNNLPAAVKELRRAVHKSPDDMVLWAHLRRLILNKAMVDLQPQLALEVSNRVALFRAVNVQKRTAHEGTEANVMADLQEALKLDAVSLLMSGREKKHVRLSAVLRAKSWASKVLHHEPCDAVAWFLLATCHYSAALLSDHVTERTLHELNTLFDTCQHHHLAAHYVTCFKLMLSHVHLLCAVAAQHVTQHRERALALLTDLSHVTLDRKLQSDTSRHMSLAHSLHGDDKQRKTALVTALRADPHNRGTWLQLAQHYVAQGQSAAVLECFTRARGLFRSSVVDYVALTLKQIEWQYRSEQYLKALKACDELAQHCATHHAPVPAVLHVIQALVAANLNHKSKIQPALTRALAADPSLAQLPLVTVLQQYAP